MRHTEFWSRMENHLGESYARSWASSVVIGSIGGRTTQEALDAGVAPKEIWRAVCEVLDLPASER